MINKCFAPNTEFIVTVHQLPEWLYGSSAPLQYGLIELCNGQFRQSWGPYHDADHAFKAQANLAARAALPFEA